MRDALQAAINASYDAAAVAYVADPAHRIAPDEEELWLTLLMSVAPLGSGAIALDVGAGTGVLTRLLARIGASATGLEPSPGMLAAAKSATPASGDGHIDFLLGDAHDGDLFPANSFDLIVSRQAICYFADPLLVFSNWRRWLKDGGRVLAIDGLWTRKGWDDGPLIDQLPLSCLQTRATIAYLLAKSGFRVESNMWLDAINACLRATSPNAAPRYAIIAAA